MTNIALISDSSIVNEGLYAILSNIQSIEISNRSSFQEAYSIEYTKIDFIILYFSNHTTEHYFFNHFIHSYYPTIKILLLLSSYRLTSIPSSFLHLADANLLLNTTTEQLLTTIEQLIASDKKAYYSYVEMPVDEKELLLLHFLQENYTNKKIATYFNVSERSVERYFQKIYALFNVHNKKELYVLLSASKN